MEVFLLGFVHYGRTAPIIKDEWYLKKIGDIYELLWLNMVKEAGWEELNPEPKQIKIKNDVKLSRNLARARQKIFELSYCNKWDWFFTGTLDPAKQDRSNLSSFQKRFSQMIRDLKRLKGIKIDYLIIPELHADLTNWHCHGLLRGVPNDQLQTINGQLSWKNYYNNFGFNDLGVIRSHEAVSKYLTKYVTKSIGSSRGVSEVGRCSYFHSQNLKTGEIIKKGSLQGVNLCEQLGVTPLFENKYCKKYSLTPEAVELISSSFIL